MVANFSNQECDDSPLTFCEFFAGGGMVRAGLGPDWNCVFANDFDLKKGITYRQNWGDDALKTEDVSRLSARELPSNPSLVWASFPCQDLSLAGMGAGLKGERSGTFWPFWRLIADLDAESRGPDVLVLENVCGTLTSHEGKDFIAISEALSAAGYTFGAAVVDAKLFVPQSRPRLFIIAASQKTKLPPGLVNSEPTTRWHTRALRAAYERLSPATRAHWVWWNLPSPAQREARLQDLIEASPQSVSWHSQEETVRLLDLMSPLNRDKVCAAQASGAFAVGTVYKRTRHDQQKAKVQRAEIRFDDIAGCLRTSSGGSSRQLVMMVNGNKVSSRLLSTREAARLMGLPDSYHLPANYNEAYHLLGDGVVVPVVRHLAQHLLEPLARASRVAGQLVA